MRVQFEDLVGDSPELGHEGSDVNPLLPVEVGYYLEVLDGGLGYPPAEIVVIAVRLRVPLRWVVDEAVEVVGLARLL